MRHTSRNLGVRTLALLGLCATLHTADAAVRDFFDLFKPKPKPAASGLAGLTQGQMLQGLKEALGRGVEHAITNLGRTDGFLGNLQVRIPVPESLASAEKTLRLIGQDRLVDDFVTTMNRAAEMAVPETGAIFRDAIQELTLEDAKTLIQGPEDALTQYFRKTGGKRIEQRMLPVVKEMTSRAGVTASYKAVTDRVSPVTSLFGGTPAALDLDQYVTEKAMDGLFKMLAEQEALIRKNPAARTTDLLRRIFGA